MPQQPSLFRAIGYAAFLACSWTWCIGMYLPVILMRDFGPWSFLVFAVPNCLGAAAMGVFLWRPGASERFLANHLFACRAFSLVTMLFQVWFFFSVSKRFSDGGAIVLGGGVVGIGLAVLLLVRKPGVRLLASIAAWITSICLVLWWITGVGFAPSAPMPTPTESALDLAALAPVCVFGFMLSPYLDLTFHAARQSVGGAHGSRVFLIAFFVAFPCLIGLTFLYGRHLVTQNPDEPWRAFAPLVQAHLIIQLLFTCILHQVSLGPRTRLGQAAGPSIILAGAVIALLPGIIWDVGAYRGLAPSEVVYRVFMAFYGLVFPAYVLICAVGADGFRGRPTRGTLIIFGVAVAAASPFYWMGFIERVTPYLLAGVAIPLFARALIKRAGPAEPPSPSPSPSRVPKGPPRSLQGPAEASDRA